MEIIFIHLVWLKEIWIPEKSSFLFCLAHTMNIDIYGILIPFIYCLRVKEWEIMFYYWISALFFCFVMQTKHKKYSVRIFSSIVGLSGAFVHNHTHNTLKIKLMYCTTKRISFTFYTFQGGDLTYKEGRFFLGFRILRKLYFWNWLAKTFMGLLSNQATRFHSKTEKINQYMLSTNILAIPK